MSILHSWRVVPAMLVCVLFVAACGSDNSKDGGSATAAGSSTSSTTAVKSAGAATLDELAARKQTLPDLPKVDAQSGKSVWIVTCSLEASGCSGLASQVKDVMESRLHWKVTTFDGKLKPATYTAGIQQALVAHAAGIVLIAIDCSSVKPALTSAKAANVPVVAVAGYDCSDPSQGGGESLMHTADLGGSPSEQYAAQGRALAEYVAAQSDGKAKAIVATEPDFQVVKTELAAFKDQLEQGCSGCELAAEAPALGADLASGAAASKLSSVVLQHPTADVMVALQDSQLAYVTNAMRTSAKKLRVLSSGGTSTDVQLIKNGTIAGVMANDFSLGSWVAADFMVRLLAKTEPVVVKPVYTLMDKDHNLPASGGFKAPVAYESLYSKAWGVAGG
jgi:ribose transport system substrate-binding protein